MKRMKKWVLLVLLLITTVVAPIFLYREEQQTSNNDDGFFTSSSSSSVVLAATTTKLPKDSSSSASLESLNDLKEPIGIIYPANSTNCGSDSHPQEQQQELPLPVSIASKDHITRVLSSSSTVDEDDPIKSQSENPIELITTTVRDNVHDTTPVRKPIPISVAANKLTGKTGITTKESVQTAGRVIRKERRKNDLEKTNDPMVVIQDARVRHLKDQLIRARVYLSLGATRNSPHFVKELRLRMKEVQRALGDATKDSELPKNAFDKLKAMEQTLAKGKQIQDDCTAVVKKLRAILHSTEEQLRVHKKQTMFLTQLAAKTLPKGLHCLPLRLSTEYYSLNSSQQQFPNEERLEDPELYHYALFSDNILAAAAVVNSTVFHAQEQEKHVFHIVTDRLNYAAMRMWFLANPPIKAAIQIQNIEELTWLNSSYSPVLEQLGSPSMIDYYFKGHRASSSDLNLKFRNPKYLSILNHLRFYLPEIFPKLKKVLFLDDDIVVQKDLTSLWSLDLKGKVNGAVETCREGFHRFDRYLNFSNPLISKNFDPHACGWAYGMNIFDLEEWKRQNITEVYHSWQKLNQERTLWKLGTLPPGLITFWEQIFPLDRSWHVLGLGYNPNISGKEIEQAAVIHYNGNMKPWLEIGIPKYRGYWAKYVDYNQVYLRECNINP